MPIVPLGRETVDTARDPPEPDPEPPVLLAEAPVTPAHPFNTTTIDATSNIAKRYLPPFARNRLWSRGDMDMIPFMNRELELRDRVVATTCVRLESV